MDLSGNHCFGQKDKIAVESLAAVFAGSTTISELNLAGAGIDPDDARILAPAIKAMGSLSSANLLGNSIGVEQAQALLNMKEAKPGLTTLCGLSGDETELDLSSKGLSPGCAILLAPEMEANRSLSKFTFSGDDHESKPVTVEIGMTEADFSGAILMETGTIILAAWLKHKVQHTAHYVSD